MATVSPSPARADERSVPPLYAGDRLTQAEFHRRYEASLPHVKAELIGGVVYMPSPLRAPHGDVHAKLAMVLGLYEGGTRGTKAVDNATTILGEGSEPQPDLSLRILREYGGRARVNENKYLEGPPELVAEIAHSSAAIDLYQKRDDYLVGGVQEYLVVCLAERELSWFDFRDNSSIKPHRGTHRSRIFPGLWVDGAALLEGDAARLIEVIQQGLASKAHAAFVKRLAMWKKEPPAQGQSPSSSTPPRSSSA
jgi:Uma2 family endonuclease